ncbi:MULTISPECIES: N-acetylmuramoyl-L-alanine amidase [unclassified Amycolatopsis]|uniref:N-acetylmuramoyl-L-alanine amidase n=1 Tax=unclassified Amycolatopsis TaxID=2618356 RepID=UPI001FF6F431|nr:N-acetylmuramoyl-L-alanine amidase [Amycolatopsis sp. FBCC-B4732]UOX87671.1 N-acetylmuramoyl-L-alanine amidase [Amycolatopsis sp. FBCC-B4732]
MVAVRRAIAPPLLAGALLLTGCSDGTPAAPAPAPVTTRTVTPTPTTVTPPPPPSTSAPSSVVAPAPGKVVVLDPGHNGGNASHPAEINRPVPAGRGQTKPCNTTGTATNAGYPEHAFTFDVAHRVGDALAAKGIRVVYTRQDDTGVGPCVDRRAAIGNEANADAVVSIHADGSTAAGANGFHVAYSSPPLNESQGPPSLRLAEVLRDTMRTGGFSTANYIGGNGLSARGDLGGLNLSTRPAALVECGNMRNAAEAARMTSAAGRQQFAASIAAAIEAYLAS